MISLLVKTKFVQCTLYTLIIYILYVVSNIILNGSTNPNTIRMFFHFDQYFNITKRFSILLEFYYFNNIIF